MIAIRWVISMALALLITLVLFYVMQALIATGTQLEQRVNVVKIVDATMPEIEMEVVREVEKPQPIEQLDTPPPDVPDRQLNMDSGPSLAIERASVSIDADLSIGGASISITDGEMLPLVNVTPTYPTRAASRGIEGWCQVSFTVTETGGVRDVIVVDAEPAGIFDTSSIRAAERFKFQPKVVDGQGVAVPNVQYVFRYQLEGDQ
ncbi:MAG: TonB family protein [Gammaproteobacteria bacterium]|nr:TonB family protein [Gammaproteobacteria bacterium]MDP2141146.1 TonB family protein [Gammaproteobacteria bacterium]MDP2349180.1 TonB family protein [Gammaproteobacteria bacterium]